MAPVTQSYGRVVPTTDSGKEELLSRLCSQAARLGAGAPDGIDADPVLRTFFRHVAFEDLVDRTDADLLGAAVSQLKLAGQRPQGTASIKVFTPTVPTNGWSAQGHTVVQVITDDMPFLVDSVSMALDAKNHELHQLIHPQVVVRRDMAGKLLGVLDDQTDASQHDVFRESWMYVEIDRVSDVEAREIEARLHKVLSDVREAVEDWQRMHNQIEQVVAELGDNPPPWSDEPVEEDIAFLRWLADNHFTFLGYREYHLEGRGDDELLHAVPGTGFGILRTDPGEPTVLPPLVAAKAREKKLLVLAKANSRATVHRPVYLDYVGVKTYDEQGEVTGERRFLGLFSSAAYTESVNRIPLLRAKAQAVLDEAGFDPASHAGKALLDVLETYPRDELFATPADELEPIAAQVMQTRERRQLRLFVRRDVYGRFLSCLVYLPRDRYNTTVRERIATILKQQLGGDTIEYTAHVGEAFAARLHFVIRPAAGESLREVDVPDLERRCAEAARSWRDDFVAAVVATYGEESGTRLARNFADSFPEAYKEDFAARTGAADLAKLDEVEGDAIALSLYEPLEASPGEARLKVYRNGSSLSLSQILPMLSDMGVEVIDERPYRLERTDADSWIYDFGLRYDAPVTDEVRGLFTDAVMAVWDGRHESDGFNALVLDAGLGWRQVMVLRAYARYQRQGGVPFAQDYIEDALRHNVGLTRLLIDLFEARFAPGERNEIAADSEARVARCHEIEERILRALDDVASLDHDRILRGYLTAIKATLRTNWFQVDANGAPLDKLSLKLDPSAIGFLPEPRPKFEIFVYSPKVEGVHLRFGAVARGGLRWSDRRDDFRTEVLGLVKAQMVKNTVIVPVGAKGGFFAKQLPDPSDRDAWLAEGQNCYRTFISGLLDITDNLIDGVVVPPERVVRHDGDDPYLVVAADKGTASFSDIANGVSADYGFWLGDAFASGGSVGYDHKAMGITARGAWVSVQRHFRDRGIDCQTEDFTAVGIGDMSGDVFGNGMLCSEHTRLIAAFDHRDIFIDPDPDAAASYAERQRLFDLPRSSWRDYDESLISEGGGIYSRSAKSIQISAAAQEALGIEESSLAPNDLMRAILKAPVDLLWNGGIGTYVKAESETDADAGDKANDPIRVNGGELRAQCVGEGGNLGFTQLGRIEYARHGIDGRGGRMNTDFIDNSAGVDTSDHEVNIKILLDGVMREGDLTEKQRNELLASMTDEVAALVLVDNYEQNIALGTALSQAPALLHVHEDWMRTLERSGQLNRVLEGLPSRRDVARRIDKGQGLTAPELSVLMAYTKIVLEAELLTTDLAQDPFLRSDLYSYFPAKMRQGYRGQMDQHQLRNEIVVTQVVNHLVNGAGITFWHRLGGETAANAATLALANLVAREIVGAVRLWREISALDNVVDAAVQTRMRVDVRTLVERVTRWIINNRRAPLDSEQIVADFDVVLEGLVDQLPDIMSGRELKAFEKRRDQFLDRGVPEALATKVACAPPAYMLLGIAETAAREELDPREVAQAHFDLGERLELPGLITRILALPRDDRWQSMARAALRDDLHGVHAQLTAQELAGRGADGAEAAAAVSQLKEICSEENADLARLSVALRVVRSLLN